MSRPPRNTIDMKATSVPDCFARERPRPFAWRRLASGAAICIAALLACSCRHSVSTGTADTLVFGRNKDALNLDPALAQDGLSLSLDEVMLEGLTRYRPGSFNIEPGLATSWKVDGTGRTWTFTLRRNVKFQDGTSFDAGAVKFNIDRWRLRDSPYHKYGIFTYYQSQFGGFPGIIAAVQVLAPDKIVLHLSHPMAPLLANLAEPAFAMSSPTAIRAHGADYFRRPIGTGPYALSEWIKDDHITLRRFDGYWGPKPRITTVVVRDFPDPAVTRLALENGDIDGWEFPRPDDVAALSGNANMRVYQRPPNSTMYLAINTQRPALNDVRVRRAINEAIDARTITQRLFERGTVRAKSFLPPTVWPRGVPTAYRYDPPDAKRLLREAGYPHGFKTRLWYMTAPRPYLPQPERVAEAIQADLKAVGIDAALQGLEWGTFLHRVMNAEHDLTLAGWTGDNGDPDNFLYPPLDLDNAHPPGAYNLAFWRNAAYHRLIVAAQSTLPIHERARLYVQALRLIHEDAPVVPIAYPTTAVVFSTRVAGVVPAPDGSEMFQHLHFKRDGD